uniref:FkbM family methyltransferase n=1 Tax=Algoriphagus sp. TaxID=1872435 RepID=UPI0040483127
MKSFKNKLAIIFPRAFKFLSSIYNENLIRPIWLMFNRPKGILVYVGANVGESLGRICYRFEYTFAYEPNPVNFEKAKHRLRRDKNIKLFNLAASDNKGTANLNISDNGNDFAASSLAEYSSTRKIGIQGQIIVNTIILSDHLQEQGVTHIDYYVSDTEGYDLIILRTMNTFIVNNRIHKIACEIVKKKDDGPFKIVCSSMDDFKEFLPINYELKATGWTNLKENVFDEVPDDWNFYDALWVNSLYNPN